MNKKDFTFIVPAAGESRRFKSKKNKIFYKYKNKALILHVLDKCLKFTKNIIFANTDLFWPDLMNDWLRKVHPTCSQTK